MRERERKESNLINKVLEKYPKLFDEHFINDQPYYLERMNPQKVAPTRFLLLPSGIGALIPCFRYSKEDIKKELWNFEAKEDKDVLILDADETIKNVLGTGTTNNKYLIQQIHDYGNFFIRVIPFYDDKSLEIMTCLLDQRYEDIQNQLPLTEI